MHAYRTVITNTECANAYGNIVTPTEICTDTFEGMSTCHVRSHPNILQNANSYIHNILFPTPTQTTGMITLYLYHIFDTLSVLVPTVGSGPWQKSVCKMIHFFPLSNMSSPNFQAFRLTIVISTGRITFHNFNCLVLQCDSGGPFVYLEMDGN
jgi:hypothetical protein